MRDMRMPVQSVEFGTRDGSKTFKSGSVRDVIYFTCMPRIDKGRTIDNWCFLIETVHPSMSRQRVEGCICSFAERTQQLVQNDAMRNRSAPFSPSYGALAVQLWARPSARFLA